MNDDDRWRDGYDRWKTNAPDPGSGSAVPDVARTFWRLYAYAQNRGYVEILLKTHRGIPLFASLVSEADALWCERCGEWAPRGKAHQHE